jgi:hypothetical protein
MPDVVAVTANLRIAPTTMRKIDVPKLTAVVVPATRSA